VSDLYAVIGGSGLYSLDENFRVESRKKLNTPYGDVSAELASGELNGTPIIFLPRHGTSHQIPPHKINYRANLWALHELGVNQVIAVNAVGGIDFGPHSLVLPDQIIDYTSGRAHTYFDGEAAEVGHIDFTYPYSEAVREKIILASQVEKIFLNTAGTYGCTNGPRLETSAEIVKMKRDGCNIIGMTGMPEAALARELEIEYASISLVVNWCAGIENSILHMDEIRQTLERGMKSVVQLINSTLEQVN
jgi:5'-methylthioinosine phosphorylase